MPLSSSSASRPAARASTSPRPTPSIHFDPWWNPAVEQQATDRAHRIGQTKVVTAYRLVAAGHDRGEDPAAQAARSASSWRACSREDTGGAKKLTKADIEELFSVD
ncbi:MAG: C-terminal helicase domain-containing protein [Cypionkella sp.]